VLEINGASIRVKNSFDETLQVSADILHKMDSASHFAKEIKTNMTELAEVLEMAGDMAFTVSFRKKVTEDNVCEKLGSTSVKDLSDDKFRSQLAKQIVEGEECTITCHLVEAESSLGRSTVIDLTTSSANKFRQVDHRTINYLILGNVKYVLAKGGSKKADDVEMAEGNKKEEPKWDRTKLAVGNTFSGTAYYKADSVAGDQVMASSKGGANTAIAREILETQMYSAGIYAKEEKMSLTKVAAMLESANTACLTVCFTTKVDDKDVKDQLSKVTAADLKDTAKLKNLAKALMTGKETTIVGRLSKSMGKLGRSLVIDLPTQGYRQVDHRTIKWLILRNVKYVVSK
jgi:hypothetical protein